MGRLHRTKQLVEDKTIYLEKDVSETDRFGRLLRYVYLENGEMVNELLVRDGYAQVSTFPPDVNYQERFLAAQREAREANRGLWGACQAPAATPVPSERQQPGAAASRRQPSSGHGTAGLRRLLSRRVHPTSATGSGLPADPPPPVSRTAAGPAPL